MNQTAAQRWPTRWAAEPFLYLTTLGRRTGRPHRIEIWFAVHDKRLYLMAGGGDRADWVRNIKSEGRVTVELGNQTHQGVAHIVEPHTADDRRARELLVAKYADREDNLKPGDEPHCQWSSSFRKCRYDFLRKQLQILQQPKACEITFQAVRRSTCCIW